MSQIYHNISRIDEFFTPVCHLFCRKSETPKLLNDLNHAKTSLKKFYDFTHILRSQSEEKSGNAQTAIPELIIAGFDCETIWQQIEHNHNASTDIHTKGVELLPTKGTKSLNLKIANHSKGPLTTSKTSKETYESKTNSESDGTESNEDYMSDVYASSHDDDSESNNEGVSNEDELEDDNHKYSTEVSVVMEPAFKTKCDFENVDWYVWIDPSTKCQSLAQS